MATVLDLAREVRHRLVLKDTGCLIVDYPGDTVSIHFWEGTVATQRTVFLSCFVRNPVDFRFRSMEIQKPSEPASGASLLTEAIDAIDLKSLVRVLTPYAEWRIGSRSDLDLHNTFLKVHLGGDVASLRRLMRLAVSGSICLEPPNTLVTDEMHQIEEAFDIGNWRLVLGVEAATSDSEIKRAYRNLARRFHPDRWVTSANMKLRDRIERTFQRVAHAYSELQNPHSATLRFIEGRKQKQTLWKRMYGFLRKRML